MPLTICGVALAILLILLLITLSRTGRRNFAAHSRPLNNPMQGFYAQCDSGDFARLASLHEFGVELVLLACNLNGYQERPLDEDKLSEIELALSMAEHLGLGVIFRAAYGFDEGMNTVEPRNLEQVRIHIRQLSPLLNKHADNLLCLQAGMLGPWGEWHSSRLMGQNPGQELRVRNDVAGSWLENLDKQIIVQLRRPEFIRQAVEAGWPIERLGLHNDALLASDSDMGTYRGGADARSQELSWVDQNLWQGRSGGEMPQISEYTQAANAVAEFSRLHLTYLNRRYNQEVLESWQQQLYQGENALEYIEAHLGSRLYLQRSELPRRLVSLPFVAKHYRLTLANNGFAPAQSRLSYWLIFSQNGGLYYEELAAEGILREESGGITLRGPIALPPELDGSRQFELGLWLGYGSPEKGRAYYLANQEGQGIKYQGEILYFASYQPALQGWILQP